MDRIDAVKACNRIYNYLCTVVSEYKRAVSYGCDITAPDFKDKVQNTAVQYPSRICRLVEAFPEFASLADEADTLMAYLEVTKDAELLNKLNVGKHYIKIAPNSNPAKVFDLPISVVVALLDTEQARAVNGLLCAIPAILHKIKKEGVHNDNTNLLASATKKTLPAPLNTERGKLALDKAVEEGYMSVSNGVYKWEHNNGTLFACFLGMLLFKDKIIETAHRAEYRMGKEAIPKSFDNYFGIKDLQQKRYQKNQNNPPAGYEVIASIIRSIS